MVIRMVIILLELQQMLQADGLVQQLELHGVQI